MNRNNVESVRLKLFLWLGALTVLASVGRTHIIPPENYHPVAESFRRMNFVLNLNPVIWTQVGQDVDRMGNHYMVLSAEEGKTYHEKVSQIVESGVALGNPGEAFERKKSAREVFELSTRAVARMIELHLRRARESLSNYSHSLRSVNEARRIWESFSYEVQATDTRAFSRLGIHWLELSSSLESPGILKFGRTSADTHQFDGAARAIISYLKNNYGESFCAVRDQALAPLPLHSPTFDPGAKPAPKLPPGHDINKQVPRPRQILNMVARGVDEHETALIALGDMAFDSSYIFGEPARTFQISCNTCHNKSITNPLFFIPGLSSTSGGLDVSNSFFAPHANNGHFDPLDIPDLRGIRFTAPYGRNGRFSSLREFVRNVIVNEFNGPEPDPMLLDGLIAYMLEFDFLPNPNLKPDGTLVEKAPPRAKRGEKIFHRPFAQMGGRSCASCHIPSDHFLDHKRHDIGTVTGTEPYSWDRALDTPTLLSIKFTAPYFHDGSQPTLRSVNVWFNERLELGLDPSEIDDLTTFVEAISDGTDGYEDSPYYLDAELEEFSFFLSTYEFLKARNKNDLIDITFTTIANEIRNHKWELQDHQYLPIMDQLTKLMEEAYLANQSGAQSVMDQKVAEYRKIYSENAENLK